MIRAVIIIAVVLAGLALAVANRFWLMVQILALAPITLLIDKQDEGPNVEWYDDYYTLEWLDERTIAIGEPVYYQQNINYLILGDERAILFDAGPGLRNILPLVEELTDKPVTFVPSHFHYDHLGDGLPFDDIAVVNLPHISNRVHNGVLALKWHEHLGAAEGYTTPSFTVDQWLEPGGEIDIGNRVLEVVFTPGHTNDSISLYDPQADFLFSGDFIYPGDIFAFLPNSSLGEYAQGSDNVLASISDRTRIYAAHRINPPGAPVLTARDVRDLKQSLNDIRSGDLGPEGLYPVRYAISDTVDLLAEPPFLQRWDITYPELSVNE